MMSTTLKMTAIAAMLCGGTLYADAFHAGKKESASQQSESRKSGGFERSQRSDSFKQRPETRRQITPEPILRGNKIPKSKAPKAAAKVPQRKEFKPAQKTHKWVPPAAKPLPYYHRPGYTIRTIPKVAVTVTLGSLVYYYADGIYYRRHHSGYIVIVPPIGLIVPVLPLGYTVFQLYGGTYYYYAGVYYVWDIDHRAYRVVDVPDEYVEYQPGDIIDKLPDGAYTVTIDGVQYYRYGGVYFLQSIQGDRVVYVVVTP
jgi:hypothetical protein